MSNIIKSIEQQKYINNAVQGVFDYLIEQVSYSDILQKMNDAQINILRMMELSRVAAENLKESVSDDEITAFLYEANAIIKLIRPFAYLLGQINGDESVRMPKK